ncbi:hypothetical protein TNCT_224981 [Trichonephila clavata]|uniref:Uncharacterized protein n=1 Tax=Trichonephila clavata TaxID=2740835 RepID=A0A8X6HKC1_TRICU|nr:hypothetical protein TNCT_224981 [Trichonephila clavata]
MDVDPPKILCLCRRRGELESDTETNEILLMNYHQLIDFPDTEANQQLKQVVRNSIRETMQGKDAMAVDLESLSKCNNPNCSIYRKSRNSSPMIEEVKNKTSLPILISSSSPASNQNALFISQTPATPLALISKAMPPSPTTVSNTKPTSLQDKLIKDPDNILA